MQQQLVLKQEQEPVPEQELVRELVLVQEQEPVPEQELVLELELELEQELEPEQELVQVQEPVLLHWLLVLGWSPDRPSGNRLQAPGPAWDQASVPERQPVAAGPVLESFPWLRIHRCPVWASVRY